MIQKKGQKAMEYLHVTLLLALFVPLVYAVTGWSDPAGTAVLYLKCLLAAVPVVVTGLAAERLRSVVLYFLSGVLLLVCVGAAAYAIVFMTDRGGGLVGYAYCYLAGMLVETIFLVIKRFADRVKAARQRREEPLAAEYVSVLERPSLSLVWYFVVFYLLGFLLNAELLCDISFYSAIVYTFLALAYEYFGATKNYLEINRRTKGISRRRLYGVSLCLLLIFALFLLLGMLPAILLAGQRQYTDIREWFSGIVPVPYEYENDTGFQSPAAAGGPDWMTILNDGKPAPEPSKIVYAVFFVLWAVCVLVFLGGVILLIRQVLRDFRSSSDENGDLVEEIEDDLFHPKEVFLSRRGRCGAESEAARIRRQYRRTIRRHRKERPAPYESPTEIEERAGLLDDVQMQQLHREYERVRYGKIQENCRISDE